MVIELDIVEIDKVTYFLINSHISSVFIASTTEVGCLRGVSYNVLRNDLSQSLHECDQPLLTFSLLHGTTILPIYINSVQVVFQDIASKFLGAFNGIHTLSSGKFSSTKSADHNFDSIIVIPLPDILLYLVLCLPERVLLSKIFDRIIPNRYDIQWPILIRPKTKSYIIIQMGGSIARNTEVSCNFLGRPPVGYLIDVSKPNRIADLWLRQRTIRTHSIE